MKKALMLAAAVACLAVPVTASAAPPADVMAAQINSLKKQVSGLTLQVTSLKSQVTAARTQVAAAQEDAAGAVTLANANKQQTTKLAQAVLCGTALQIDLFHLTWKVIDIVTTALGASPVFGYQAPMSDSGACAAIGVTRTPQGVAKPAALEQPFGSLALALRGG